MADRFVEGGAHKQVGCGDFFRQFNFVSTWPAVLLARLMGKATYFWSHGVYGNEGAVKRSIRVAFYRLASGMLLYGAYSRDLLIEYGMRADRMHVIYNSLDYSKQRQLRDLKSEASVAEVRPGCLEHLRRITLISCLLDA